MSSILTLVLTAIGLLGTTAFHYEAISILSGRLTGRRSSARRALPFVIAALVTAHVVEIAFYTAIFAFAAGPLRLGGFSGEQMMHAVDYFYFAAETYSSLGYGDIVPTGGLRLIASVEPLNGLLLLAWSGAFLYAAIHSTETP